MSIANTLTSIHQPSYFPWQGLLNKIHASDLFILMDEVQLQDRGYQHRNLFFEQNTKNEKTLTIPVQKKEYRSKKLNELKISDTYWQKKHNTFLLHNYKKHPYFEEIYPYIEHIYTKPYNYLIDVLVDSIEGILPLFEISTQIIKQSELHYDRSATKENLILELLEAIGADHYLSGHGAAIYQKEDHFLQKNIRLSYTEYQQILYKQYECETFLPGLSSLDLLFNVGSKEAKKYI